MHRPETYRLKRLSFAAACAGMLLFGICLITLGSVAVALREKFALDHAGSGTLFSILPIGILAGSFLFGPIADRYGYRLLMVLSTAGMGTGFEIMAHAGELGGLQAGVLLFGLAGGIINGTTNALVADISSTHKGANLSLLGVFFGLGALGMPLVLGALEDIMPPLQVLATSGWITMALALLYAFIPFPPAKLAKGKESASLRGLLQPFMLLTSFFLFFQSSLEAIINNWTTTYLRERGVMHEGLALYALSLHMGGMVMMRLLTGSVLRGVPQARLLWMGLGMLVAGIWLMQVPLWPPLVFAGLVLSGAGLANGFPILLGMVADRYPQASGTAFSFAFAVALLGNMLLNYLSGLLFQHYGVAYLAMVCYASAACMMLLFYMISTFHHSKN
ncbi:MAG: MFS transporter [Chitinophagaceae bacterium]|jgi:MFS family permease|nr:MFS transporter [Chitinophagaceae bacterium]